MFRMTINQLQKRLAKLISDGHGRRHVCVELSTFRDVCDATHLEVAGLGIETIHVMDGDGWCATNKDGSERFTTVLTLVGDCGADAKGNIVERDRR